MELLDFKIENEEDRLVFRMKVNDGEQERIFGVALGKPFQLIDLSEVLKVLARKVDSLYLQGIELEEKDKLPREILD